jgi:hypothetical protein
VDEIVRAGSHRRLRAARARLVPLDPIGEADDCLLTVDGLVVRGEHRSAKGAARECGEANEDAGTPAVPLLRRGMGLDAARLRAGLRPSVRCS